MLYRVLNVAFNGFCFVFLLILTFFFASIETTYGLVLALVMLISSIDALSDVAQVVTGRPLIPLEKHTYRVLNYLLETVSGLVGSALLVYALLYMSYYPIPFWVGIFITGAVMVITSVQDISGIRSSRRKTATVGGARYV